jgi:indolepyruvate ferredoxin oxidoreductase beta subunit
MRCLPMLRPGATVVVNDLKIIPAPVAMGQEVYPADIPAKIASSFPDTVLVNGMDLAMRAGNVRTVNIALLGALSRRLDLAEQHWHQALTGQVPERFLAENLQAFELGRAV